MRNKSSYRLNAITKTEVFLMELTDEAKAFLERSGETSVSMQKPVKKIFQLTDCSDHQLTAPSYRGSSGCSM